VAALRHDPTGVEVGINGVQESFVAQARIPSHGLYDQVWVIVRQLQQQRCGGVFFTLIRREDSIQQRDAEAALRVGEP
jgi:hypothetical protein